MYSEVGTKAEVMEMRFLDRVEAGRMLAVKLRAYANRPDVIVLALPRGGVPVAFEVARALKSPLDVLIVRKLGAPDQPELAMGAIASGGVRVLNEELLRYYPIPDILIESVAAREQKEIG
jgi:putative phosphoribosyl transferase